MYIYIGRLFDSVHVCVCVRIQLFCDYNAATEGERERAVAYVYMYKYNTTRLTDSLNLQESSMCGGL